MLPSIAPASLPGRPASGWPGPFDGSLFKGWRWPWPRSLPRLGRWADDFVFRGNHRHRLVYNACWEDPALDRELLDLSAASRVVMITSAGCNALDYLLDDPAEIHAVDVNPRQNALLDLKLALIAEGRFEMGTLVLRRFRGLWEDLSLLLEADSLEEQRRAFGRIEPRLWNAFTCWLLRRPATLSLLGVPRAQTSLIVEQWPGGILGYLRDKLRWVATEIPMRDNYFWRVYIQGAYTPECCPSYLKRENFDPLRRRAHRVRTHTCLLSSFLAQNPAPYSHYVLLDHQDWLAGHDPDALATEWRLILENSRPGTRILFRSAAPQVDFLPPFAAERVRFHVDWTSALHTRDRVGTYGSLHLAEVL